jgi:hypothetical protein
LAKRRAVRHIFIESCKNVTKNFEEKPEVVVDKNNDLGHNKKMT